VRAAMNTIIALLKIKEQHPEINFKQFTEFKEDG